MNLFLFLASAIGAGAQWWTYSDPAYTDIPISITINSYIKYQTMIGGGCSGAFGIACQQFGSVGLSPQNSERVTQILFDENVKGGHGHSTTQRVTGGAGSAVGQKSTMIVVGVPAICASVFPRLDAEHYVPIGEYCRDGVH